MDVDSLVHAASLLFSNPTFVEVVCLGLVALTISIAAYSENQTRHVTRDSREALSRLKTGDGGSVDEGMSKRPKPILDRLNSELRNIETLAGRSFRLRRGLEDEGFENVVTAYTDIRSLDAWPNVFVGIGLLLTFIGLALSLWDASQGAASGDPTIVKQSVTTLLKFSAVKFTTSLVALGCSILLGIVLRSQRRRAESILRKVDQKLEEVFPLLTAERIALHQLSIQYREAERKGLSMALVSAFNTDTEMRLSRQHLLEILEQAKEQTGHLQSFNSNLAIQLGEALDAKLQPMIQHLTDRMETALREMGGSIGSSNESALKSLLETFIEDLQRATKDESAALQRNLADLAGNLGTASSDLTDRMTSVFQSLENTGSRFATIITEAGSSFDQNMGRMQSEMGTGLAEALSAIRASAELSARQSEDLLQQFSSSAVSFKSNVEGGATAFVEELDRGTKSIDELMARFGGSVDRLGVLFDRASAFGDSSARLTAERIEQLQETLRDVDAGFKRVSEATTPFSRAAEQVRGAIDLLRTTETSVQARVAELANAATAMAESSDELSQTIEDEVTRLSDGLGKTTDRLAASIGTIAQQSERAGQTLSDTIGATLAEYQKRFSGIDQELQTALHTITANFAATYEEIRKRVSEVDMQMAKAVNHLATHNDTFLSHTEDLNDAVQELSVAMKKR